MVKTKGCINTPMTQLVEIVLEEEYAIKSERFKKGFPDRGAFMNKSERPAVRTKTEPAEVRVTTVKCYRCQQEGHRASQCRNLALCKKCKKTGHETKDCREGSKQGNKQGNWQ
jgi:hypothetical protein